MAKDVVEVDQFLPRLVFGDRVVFDRWEGVAVAGGYGSGSGSGCHGRVTSRYRYKKPEECV
jgi:hypothetical protein